MCLCDSQGHTHAIRKFKAHPVGRALVGCSEWRAHPAPTPPIVDAPSDRRTRRRRRAQWPPAAAAAVVPFASSRRPTPPPPRPRLRRRRRRRRRRPTSSSAANDAALFRARIICALKVLRTAALRYNEKNATQNFRHYWLSKLASDDK